MLFSLSLQKQSNTDRHPESLDVLKCPVYMKWAMTVVHWRSLCLCIVGKWSLSPVNSPAAPSFWVKSATCLLNSYQKVKTYPHGYHNIIVFLLNHICRSNRLHFPHRSQDVNLPKESPMWAMPDTESVCMLACNM